MRLGKKLSLLLVFIMLLSPLLSVSAASNSPVNIKGGDFSMVPGEFSVMQFTADPDVNINSYTWQVNNAHVVKVDEKTGRIDALGTGKATITLKAEDQDGNHYASTCVVRVSGEGKTPIVEPIPELQNNQRPEFMMGADVSSLYQLMKAGKSFYDLEGQKVHLFDVLEENGVNWVRLRVWNDPYDEYRNPYGGGNSNLQTTIELAKQAKQRGMKLFVTFHYSDFWAHPGQQIKPKAWDDLSGQDLVDAVGDFTKTSLDEMKKAGVYPNMVGIGNETNSDILEQQFELTSEGDMNPVAVDIFKAGAAAVRSTDPNVDDPEKKALVSFHLANGNNSWLYNSFALAMEKNNVDYEALGASYYPSWHGTYEEVLNNLNHITERYGKDAFIAETAYPWTIQKDAGDDTPQNFKHGDVSTVGLAASVQGQATALREVLNVAAKIDNQKGLGAFYWEPAWLPGNTTGWATPYGTGWEVAGLFDINGYVLPSIKTFNLVKGNQTLPDNANAYAYGWETQVEVNKGEKLQMPEKIVAVQNNGKMGDRKRTITRQPVEWNEEDVAAVDTNVPGEYMVFGSVAGKADNAFAHVIVKEGASASAVAPVFSLPDNSKVNALGNGYSYSSRHNVDEGSFIELETETPNAEIYFTLDGADPITGAGSTKQFVGAPYIKDYDSIRVYAGPIQISQNVEIQATAKRSGYEYDSGSWGSAKNLLDYSPIVIGNYKAVYDYSSELLENGGFETGKLDGWKEKSKSGMTQVITVEDHVTKAYAGDHAVKFSLNPGGKVELSQKAKKLPDGQYTLSVYARSDKETTDKTELNLSAFTQGKEYSNILKMTKVPGGKMIWRKYSVENIQVTNGNLNIKFEAESDDRFTGYLDHIVLEKQ
ncbi:glycosyl hydrolase 53 family protein [Sediminibacillus halophilus]|uniref:Arabinogalactan endo-beta-1,4-galactanase n=1 Tax=Sediminibacillus halophilus TaxID=482461 RepID=A0A1G9UCW1_9BACI|nr:glycosyl hydrolase 53 family protein [Sediminibacillus halophilus]SDM57760.1 Arabinogalactan endo-1,4-beta-galactosidase [Sediminibacillus halophilus]